MSNVDVEKQLTIWAKPNHKMMAVWRECPECHTIGSLAHEPDCTTIKTLSRRCATTQFGPCDYGTWCERFRDQLQSKGAKVYIAHEADDNDMPTGRIAVCEV